MGSRSRVKAWQLMVGALLAAFMVAGPVAAHDPDNESPSRRWTCRADTDCDSGTSFTHHSNADARWQRWCCTNPINDSGWVSATDGAAAIWSSGHTFDFDYSSNASGSYVYTVAGDPCWNPSWNGCVSLSWSGSHFNESGSHIEFSDDVTSDSFRLDLATHEFGHLLGLGHSSQSSASMWSSAHAGANTLSDHDTRGRSQIYGHAHGWWS